MSRRDLTGALCGLAAFSVSLAAASIGGAVVDGAAPPLQVLGDWVIRSTPIQVTEAIIGAVGHHDKQLLKAVMLLVAVVAASLVGIRFVRGRRVEALVSVGLLGLLPVLAAINRPATSVGALFLVLLPSAVLGAVVLRALLTEAPDEAVEKAEEHARLTSSSDLDRRQALTASVVLAASAAIGIGLVRQLTKPSMALVSRLRGMLPAVPTPLPALVDELASRGASPLVTPTEEFYRIDIAQTPPQVDPESWSLTISRDGKTLGELSYDDLLALSLHQADVTIGCVSNEVGGDLVGTARWQGVLLGDLLRSHGVTRAGRVSGTSVDGFLVSFAGHYAFDGRSSMVAVGMNDEVLPILHGFPARLVVPGLYGYTSATKWLSRIDVSDRTDLPGFWATRGWAASQEVHIMSRIDSPHGDLSSGRATIAGVAWAPTVGVGTVEVQVDDGPWQKATLSKAVSGVLWRQWALPWDATSGEHRLTVRATDASGKPQETDRAPVFPSGATGLHTVAVTVD
jgi:DMSO/TMAO reductase YedYZ molybdopterin-dependent catalytic subunit